MLVIHIFLENFISSECLKVVTHSHPLLILGAENKPVRMVCLLCVYSGGVSLFFSDFMEFANTFCDILGVCWLRNVVFRDTSFSLQNCFLFSKVCLRLFLDELISFLHSKNVSCLPLPVLLLFLIFCGRQSLILVLEMKSQLEASCYLWNACT